MSLESIVEHILNEARLKREEALREARKETERIVREAREEAKRIAQEALDKEKLICQSRKQGLLVSARLEAKNNLLAAKQELLDAVFSKLTAALGKTTFKKQQVFSDKVQDVPVDICFYVEKIRLEYETEIARMLFE